MRALRSLLGRQEMPDRDVFRSAVENVLADAAPPRLSVSAVAQESDGWLVSIVDGRERRLKAFWKDGFVVERPVIPKSLQAVYEELPGGSIRLKGVDPVAAEIRASGAEIWAVRHGESLANQEGLLNGQGTDKPLTETGRVQAESAAGEQYRELGGDVWARRVLSGDLPPVVILQSPRLRARQTADALKRLLTSKRKELSIVAGTRADARLYEERILPGLLEIAYGRWDGRLLSEIRGFALWLGFDCYQGLGKDMLDRFPGVDADGRPGESRFDVMLRQRRILEGIARRYGGRKVVLFSHFETVAAQQAALGLWRTTRR